MPFALMFDEEKKMSGRIKSGLQVAHIILTTTDEQEIFLERVVTNNPDVVVLTYKSFGQSPKSLKTFLSRIRDANPCIPALLLVPPGPFPSNLIRDLSSVRQEKLFDIVRCDTGFIKEMTFRVTRLLESARSIQDPKPANRSDRSPDQGSKDLLKHLVPELRNPETGRIDTTKVSDMFAVPVTHVAEMLSAKPVTVHKTPDAPALQEKLGQLERIAAGLLRLTGSVEGLRMWLNAPNQDLDRKIPLDLLRGGQADVVANLLEDVLLGQPA